MAVKLNVVMTIPGKDPREFEYEFDQQKITLGRDQTNDIQVPLSTVSRNHAVFFETDGEWYLEDLESTHGTKHNGKLIGAGGKKLLRDGDVVEIVHFKITFLNAKGRVSADYSAEKTEALARKMVEEVLASIGKDTERPYLRVMNGPDEGAKFEIGPDVSEATVGRGTDCDFQINDANISRQHAVVRRDWNEITIEDAGSKNGVVINERKITRPTALRDADEILLGAVRLTFIDPSAKFIGKLDDIPGFAAETGHDSEDAVVSEEEEPVEESQAEASVAEPQPSSDEQPRSDEARNEASSATRGGVQGTTAVASGEGDPEDAPDIHDDSFIRKSKKTLGTLEMVLIGSAVVVVVALLVSLALLLVA
jgi:pSer/pThr/pTyr-binding forkhead associated (FHA) protein